MKSYREFIAEEIGNKIVRFKKNLAGATDPAEIERLKKAISDAELQGKQLKTPEVPKKSTNPIKSSLVPSTKGILSKVLPVVGKVASTAFTGYDIYSKTKERQDKGERLRTAVPKAAAQAGGGFAAGMAAASLASKVLPKNPYVQLGGSLVAGALGYSAGETAVGGIIKKLEGGNTDLDKKQQQYDMRTARRVLSKNKTYGATKGSALTGIGGPTKVDTKAGTLTSKGKTVKLDSTQLIRDPKTGRQSVGDLVYRGGKATYIARPSVASRDSVISSDGGGLLRNIQRGLNIGGQRERDAIAAKTEYRTALKNTQAYTKGLGITTKSATSQKLPGYGTAPAPKPAPAPAPKPKSDVASRRMRSIFGMG